MEGRQGLRCGEANPNQRLGGTLGQTPNADSQRQPYKDPPRTRWHQDQDGIEKTAMRHTGAFR